VRLLVTNDDGIDAVGIHVLVRALADAGHDLLVVAPDGDRSGTSASLGGLSGDTRLEARPVEVPDAAGVEAWAIDGPPALCVLAARLGGFGEPPEVVVSGINAGLNTGRAILHSGTVGAVLTGQNFGMSGLAVSAQSPNGPDERWYWDTAAALAVEVLELVLRAPARSAVNLNVPARPRREVVGIRWARLAPFGEVRAGMAGTDDDGTGRRRLEMELRLTEHDFDPDSDQGLVRAGYAAITTLVGVVEAWPAEEGLGPGPEPAEVEERVVPGAPLHPAHRIPDASARGVLQRPPVAG